MMGFRIISVLFVLGASLMVVNSAQAADNVWETGSVDFIDDYLCTDPIHVQESWDEMMHVYYDNAGNAIRLQFTGTVALQFTNLTNGATYQPNSSGPGTTDLLTGQVIVRGSNGAVFDANGILVATDGRVVLDANGNMISLAGRSVEVCAQLGSAPY